MSVFPLRSSVEVTSDEPRVVVLDSTEAESVFAPLSPETARRLLAACHDDPASASDLAERVDTSLQNARYHLDKLVDAGLVEVVDTWYSSRGSEMDVYGPASGPIVVFPDEADAGDGASLRDALPGAAGALLLVGLLAALVQWLAPRGGSAGPSAQDVGGSAPFGAGGSGGLGAQVAALPPGALVLFGGVVAVAAVFLWWGWRARRRAAGAKGR